MLTKRTRAQTGFEREPSGPAEAESESPVRRQFSIAITFLASAGFVLAYALPGGAYDIVTRQEYGVAVWWIVGVGFALGLLPRSRPTPLALLLIAALAGYAALTALSLSWTESSERTTAEIARAVEYVGVVVLIVAILDRGSWRVAAMGVGFAALVVCALAVASRLAPGAFPVSPVYSPNGGNRLSYPFGYWNAVGAWASMSTAIGLAWSAHDPVRLRRAVALGLVPVAVVTAYLSYSRASVAGSALAVLAVLAFSRNRVTACIHTLAAAVAATIAIVAVRNAPQIANGTGTRGAGGVLVAIALAVAIAASAAVLTSDADRARLPRTFARWAGGAAVVVLVFGAAAFGPELGGEAWHAFSHPAVAQSANDPASRLTHLGGSRYDYWKAAVDAFEAKPLTGSGAGTFEFWWDQHGATGEFIRNAHSFELENMAELGIPGLLLIVVVMLAAMALLANVRRRSRRAVSIGASAALMAAFLVYVLQASVDWMWQSTAVTVLALGSAAVAAGRLSRVPPRVRWSGRLAVAVVAVCAAVIQLPGLLSTQEIRRSQAAERGGDAALAYAWANAAVSAEPWAGAPYEQRGLVLESAQRLASAATDLRRATSHDPSNFVPWLLLARVETERGNLPGAERAYERARQLRPKAGVFQQAPGR